MWQFIIVLFCMSLLPSCSQNSSDYEESSKVCLANGQTNKMIARKITTVETKNAGYVNFYTIAVAPVAVRKKFYLINGESLNEYESGLELVSDDDGVLWTTGDQKMKLERLLLPMMGFLEGQQCSFWIISNDRKTVLNTKFVPYPLVSYGKDGAEVSVTYSTPNASVVVCHGTYFNANEVLEVITQGKNSSSSRNIQCRDGRFSCQATPPDSKSYGEVLTLKILRENGDCITVDYPWGRDCFNKEYLQADPSKMKEEDRKVLSDAYEAFYNPHACTRGHVT